MPLAAVVLCALAASVANTWFDTADIATGLKNFPAHGGDVAGGQLLVLCTWPCSAFASDLYHYLTLELLLQASRRPSWG